MLREYGWALLGSVLILLLAIACLAEMIRVVREKRASIIRTRSRSWFASEEEKIPLKNAPAMIYSISGSLALLLIAGSWIAGNLVYPFTGYAWFPYLPLCLCCTGAGLSFLGTTTALVLRGLLHDPERNTM